MSSVLIRGNGAHLLVDRERLRDVGFQPPEGVKIVLIWADKDRSETGAKAAKALMRRLAEKGILGIIMSIDQEISANAKGIDRNDVLVRYGKDAFPAMSPTCVASTDQKTE